jgi:hypothetical protein
MIMASKRYELTKPNFHLWYYGGPTELHKLLVFDYRLANKLNKILKTYPLTYSFQDGEEPIFFVPSNQIYTVMVACLGAKNARTYLSAA